MTIFEKFMYSLCSIGAGVLLLSVLCVLAWLRENAERIKKG